MPRIPRVHRVEARYRNGERKLRHYLTPEAAQERAQRWLQGRPAQLNAEEHAKHQAAGAEPELDYPAVTITPSYPVTYPHPTGDLGPLEIPAATLHRRQLVALAESLGLQLETIRTITLQPKAAIVTYQPDPTDKREPLIWPATIITEES